MRTDGWRLSSGHLKETMTDVQTGLSTSGSAVNRWRIQSFHGQCGCLTPVLFFVSAGFGVVNQRAQRESVDMTIFDGFITAYMLGQSSRTVLGRKQPRITRSAVHSHCRQLWYWRCRHYATSAYWALTALMPLSPALPRWATDGLGNIGVLAKWSTVCNSIKTLWRGGACYQIRYSGQTLRGIYAGGHRDQLVVLGLEPAPALRDLGMCSTSWWPR